ncbi:glycosyl transferase family protein [Sphingomonas sp. LB-2]|uniref:glycosyl transferase family protein n=1 Tax=Sphingomonas caeni TaxID=2984949 RepID=UPI002231E083|nr:glycosyl transferase family protein [Sphingomonas caeni]MCW3846535.1 glycosyl transferase family protein [Sphingomonas caeni]
MGEAGLIILDALMREATLFAAIWFLIGGLDDLLVDLVYGARAARGWMRGWLYGPSAAEKRSPALPPGRIAVFVPAWDEASVIGPMLRTALARFDHPDYRIYVGTYPNDPMTIAAVADVAEEDDRIRLVIGSRSGGTTKADCLNTLWRALLRDEAGDEVLAVVLHDAEDRVHPLELRLFAERLVDFDAVQLPVRPLRKRGSPLVSGHYCDEFAQAHARELVVRQALGAAMPFAGVGCAIRRGMLARIAAARGGAPFDEASLTEDYELGLTVAAMGGRTAFVRAPERPYGRPIAVEAYFPHQIGAAVRQKARWMTGIALAGWDRTGWGAPGRIGDHWMRMRDRRAILEIPVLALAYAALLLWGLSFTVHALSGITPGALAPSMRWLLAVNFGLLGWRLLVRAAVTGGAYGWRDALLSIPRVIIGNVIALMAARRAMFAYVRMLAGAVPEWDKTAHHFPDDERAAA